MKLSLPVVVALLAIGVDIGLARLGYGLLLPAIRADLGGSYGTYGLIGALHLAGYLGGTLAAPRLLRERARIPRVIALAHVVVALSVAASAAASGAFTLLAARVVIGFASGIGVAAVVTEMLERVPPARRGLASGIAWGGAGLALVVSAPAGAWALGDPARWRVATMLCAVPALAIAVLALRLPPPEPAIAGAAAGCWISSWPGAAAPVAGAICVGIGLAATPAVASAFARMRSDAATAAVAFTAVTTVFGVGQLLGPLAAGVVADHAGLAAVPLFAAIVFACGTVSAVVDARVALCSRFEQFSLAQRVGELGT